VAGVCAATLLTTVPITASARSTPPELDQPGQPDEPPPEAERVEPETPEPEQPIPVEIEPAQPEPVEIEPEPTPPEPTPPEQPEAGFEDFAIPVTVREPTPEERARGLLLRKTGSGLMIGGGVVAVAGLVTTIAFTAVGDRHQSAEQPVLDDVERANTGAQIGGITLASGIAIVAIGGIVFVRGKRLLEPQRVAHLRVVPALGGVVVSGRF